MIDQTPAPRTEAQGKQQGKLGNKNASKGRDEMLRSQVNGCLKTFCVSVLRPGETLADFVEYAIARQAYHRDPMGFQKCGLLRLITPELEKPKPLPRWTRGLGERTAQCLLSAGFAGRVAVKKAAVDGYQFDKLPNWGKSCTVDLDSWL